jgi:hypothetical protein
MRLLAGHVRGWHRLARTLIAVGVVALTGCAGSAGQRSAATSDAASAGSIDIAQLDVGNYPTKPHAPLSVAGTPQSGAVIEGQRMANFTTGPWEVNSALTGFYANSRSGSQEHRRSQVRPSGGHGCSCGALPLHYGVLRRA